MTGPLSDRLIIKAENLSVSAQEGDKSVPPPAHSAASLDSSPNKNWFHEKSPAIKIQDNVVSQYSRTTFSHTDFDQPLDFSKPAKNKSVDKTPPQKTLVPAVPSFTAALVDDQPMDLSVPSKKASSSLNEVKKVGYIWILYNI